MKILFLHGWGSVPGGVKPTYLISHGHRVINPKLDDNDFHIAVSTAQQLYDQNQPDVVVGSSRGGAVALNINSETTPLVLLCPAWKRWGNITKTKSNTIVLHSRQDDIIPFENSEELISNSELPEDALIEVGSDHRLADENSLAVMLWACEILGSGRALPWLEDRDNDTLRSPPNRLTSSEAEAIYICDSCGEEIVIPLDLSEGSSQTYVEDCPVCCNPNVIHVGFDESGNVQVWSEPEQDHD